MGLGVKDPKSKVYEGAPSSGKKFILKLLLLSLGSDAWLGVRF